MRLNRSQDRQIMLAVLGVKIPETGGQKGVEIKSWMSVVHCWDSVVRIFCEFPSRVLSFSLLTVNMIA